MKLYLPLDVQAISRRLKMNAVWNIITNFIFYVYVCSRACFNLFKKIRKK